MIASPFACVRRGAWAATLAVALAVALAIALAACGGPTLSPSPTLSSASPTPSPSPTVTPSPAPDTLHPDGLATVNLDNLDQVVDPADPNGNAQQNALLPTFNKGELLFLVAGPNDASGADFWEVADQANPARNGQQFGWVPALRGLTPALVPYVPECPDVEQLTAQALSDLGGLQALVCFGSTDLTLTGELACTQVSADSNVGGAPYLDGTRACQVDQMLNVYGKVATGILNVDPRPPVVRGNYQLTGHFDDPGAQTCGYIPLGLPLDIPRAGDPWPVLACRSDFVVTSLERVQ
jgi:hypothetical protein